MQSTVSDTGFRTDRSDWLRLRTLILLRWMAIVGQVVAIAVADRFYGLQLPLGLCYLAVGSAIIANLVSVFVFPENKRLTEAELIIPASELSQHISTAGTDGFTPGTESTKGGSSGFCLSCSASLRFRSPTALTNT